MRINLLCFFIFLLFLNKTQIASSQNISFSQQVKVDDTCIVLYNAVGLRSGTPPDTYFKIDSIPDKLILKGGAELSYMGWTTMPVSSVAYEYHYFLRKDELMYPYEGRTTYKFKAGHYTSINFYKGEVQSGILAEEAYLFPPQSKDSVKFADAYIKFGPNASVLAGTLANDSYLKIPNQEKKILFKAGSRIVFNYNTGDVLSGILAQNEFLMLPEKKEELLFKKGSEIVFYETGGVKEGILVSENYFKDLKFKIEAEERVCFDRKGNLRLEWYEVCGKRMRRICGYCP